MHMTIYSHYISNVKRPFPNIPYYKWSPQLIHPTVATDNDKQSYRTIYTN